ncbi:MAG: Tyrosine--tRNA ligase [Methanocalculus sp. 52_23]|nr:MAG: Tyrosine--tRNA ligase [Methanocalculus sp. 52_23]
MDPYDLVARNTVEIVTEEELRSTLTQPVKRVYAGYEPSGEIHLGHLVTINKLIDMKEAGFHVIVLEYQLNVLELSQQVTLNRAKRSMDEVGRTMENPTVSQMVYPIMQMVDIAALDVDAAVGGIDQRKIHMLAREHLGQIGRRSPVCVHTPIVQGLDGKKMSSSAGNVVSVADSEDEIRKKIKKAFCPPETAENPIIEIFCHHIFPRLGRVEIRRPGKYGGDREFDSFASLEAAYAAGEIHAMDLKNACADGLVEVLAPAYEFIMSCKRG